MSELLIDIIGWIGSAFLLMAYYLISSGRVSSISSIYKALNILGSIFLGYNAYYYGAFPSSFVNLIWFGIAIFAVFQGREKTLKNQKKPE